MNDSDPKGDGVSRRQPGARFVGSVHSVREMIAKSEDQPFTRWDTLAEARGDPDGVVLLTGDYGGQIYLTAPAASVVCNVETLEVLLSDLDAMRMMSPAVAELHYERHPIGAGVAGGTEGGRVVDGVWVHPNLPETVRQQAQDVVIGIRQRLTLDLVREERRLRIAWAQARLDRKENREWLEERGLPTTYEAEEPTFPIDGSG